MTATVNALHNAGNDTVAEALKTLTEAVGNDEALGERRRDIIEALSGLGEQAKLQPESRKLGVVKPLFETVRSVLAMSANTATIWHQWGPHISSSLVSDVALSNRAPRARFARTRAGPALPSPARRLQAAPRRRGSFVASLRARLEHQHATHV